MAKPKPAPLRGWAAVGSALNVYKPRGMTRYGQRKQRRQRQALQQGHARRPAPAG